MEKGIIYILTNESMPGLIKIGRTEKNLKKRLQDLDTTGVPTPFNLHYAIEIDDYKRKEQFIHRGLSEHRIRMSREFFKFAPESARALLQAMGGKEVDSEYIGIAIDEKGNEVQPEEYISRLPQAANTTFEMLQIPIGEELNFTRNPQIKCKVIENRKVEYNHKIYSLSALTVKIMRDKYNSRSHNLNGFQYWEYKDEILTERREKLEANNKGEEDF